MPAYRLYACLPVGVYVQVVLLCHREGLVLLADEVYQENVYGDLPFVSLRKVRDLVGGPFLSHPSSAIFVAIC